MEEQLTNELPENKDKDDILDRCKKVLSQNKRGDHTVPANGLYPHQWLWDSCFIAIGLRHYAPRRAEKELEKLTKAQWSNGMLPHMILTNKKSFYPDSSIWRSRVNPAAPLDYETSGMTQPPMLAEAVVQLGDVMDLPERRTWYKKMYPALLAHHQWLYADRDPHGEGLVLQLHPWETGLDSTPPWMTALRQHQMPLWIRLVEALHIDSIITKFRRDTQYAPSEERQTTIEVLAMYHMQRRLRRKGYDTGRALQHSLLAIEDLSFNAIFIRANQCLKDIAELVGQTLPPDLNQSMDKTIQALENLWDPYSNTYYSRHFASHKLLKEPSIATLMPLYAGCISQERAAQLVAKLHDQKQFDTEYPIPSVPVSSPWFKPRTYWQGPSWINMNWFIIQGLRQYGFDKEADLIREQSIKMVDMGGCAEYFNPIDGQPAGAKDFSWTAALTIDLLEVS